MIAAGVIAAIKVAIKENELGDASPYELSYAKLGASGASFGIFQGDTNVNDTARATLLTALQVNDTDETAIERIMAAVSRPCPAGDPLAPDDSALANAALSSAAGRAFVDAMDGALLQVVLNEVDACIAAAARRNLAIDPTAQLYIALWVNMTGEPDTLREWLAGTQEVNLPPPTGVTATELVSYLSANAYFRLHPRNLVHMQDSVNAATALLPAA